MKSLAVAVLVVAGSAFAQEIGTEITPTTPTSGVQQQNNPPPPQQDQPKSGYVYKPKGAKDDGGSGSAAGPAFTGNKVSASSGDFGIRAGFSSGLNLNTGSSSSTSTSALAGLFSGPGVGIAYFASDAFKLLVDLGFGMVIVGSGLLVSVGTVVGFDYLFRTPGDALRPFFHFAGSFNLVSFGSALLVNFGAQLGFGAEYFFNPAFSVNGRMMLSVPMAVSNSFVIGFVAVPAIGATWYL